MSTSPATRLRRGTTGLPAHHLFDHVLWLRIKVSGDLVVLVQPYQPVLDWLPPAGLDDLVCWPCGDAPHAPAAHAYLIGRSGAMRRLQKLGRWTNPIPPGDIE